MKIVGEWLAAVHLYSGDEDLLLCALLHEWRGFSVNGQMMLGVCAIDKNYISPVSCCMSVKTARATQDIMRTNKTRRS